MNYEKIDFDADTWLNKSFSRILADVPVPASAVQKQKRRGEIDKAAVVEGARHRRPVCRLKANNHLRERAAPHQRPRRVHAKK